MSNTAITEYCPECGDEFEMVCTTIWVNGKRLHEDCQRRATIASQATEIERLREALTCICLNALIQPDAAMAGATDCYAVPIGDIQNGHAVLKTQRREGQHDTH